MSKVTLFLSTNWPEWQTTTIILGLLHHEYALFTLLFLVRYFRLVLQLVGFWLYAPDPVPHQPLFTERDCTVIIPTMDPSNINFTECLSSVLRSGPAAVHIVTFGDDLARLAEQVVERLQSSEGRNVAVQVRATKFASRRRQIASVLPFVRTRITIVVDDRVLWPSSKFLPAAIAPFEDLRVGGVATNKRARRTTTTGFGFRAFSNFISALYLEQHNFETRAANVIDGGFLVDSGSTYVYRTSILQDSSLLSRYTNEQCFSGLFGPSNAEDDSFMTRWLLTQGWKIKVQEDEHSLIEAQFFDFPETLCHHWKSVCWAQMTCKSNAASLLTDPTVWLSQPGSVYAVYFSQLINLPVLYDAALFYALSRTDLYGARAMGVLGTWIIASKMVKLLPYLYRHPRDLIYLPGYFAFAYLGRFIELSLLLTFWNANRAGRAQGNVARQVVAPTTPLWIEDPIYDDFVNPVQTQPATFSDEPAVLEVQQHPRSTARIRPIQTPWGLVKPEHLHQTPANVLLDRRAQTSTAWPRGWTNASRQSHGPVEEVPMQMFAPSTPPAMTMITTWAEEKQEQLAYPTPISPANTNINIHIKEETPTPSPLLAQFHRLIPEQIMAHVKPLSVILGGGGCRSTGNNNNNDGYSRTWVRAEGCGRIHSELHQYNLRHRRCNRNHHW